jgi:hypothetical protein
MARKGRLLHDPDGADFDPAHGAFAVDRGGLDFLENVHPVGDAPEDRVVVVEIRRVPQDDEKRRGRAGGIVTARHRDDAPDVVGPAELRLQRMDEMLLLLGQRRGPVVQRPALRHACSGALPASKAIVMEPSVGAGAAGGAGRRWAPRGPASIASNARTSHIARNYTAVATRNSAVRTVIDEPRL